MARLPMYRQIANAIREKITNNEYKVGEALPTEAELREIFSVSRVTVRQAIKLLVENGELESVQGSGTYVTESKVKYDIYQQSSFDEKWAHLDVVTHSDVIAFEVGKASLTIAEHLDIAKDEQVFYVKRVRYIDNNPITVEETWLPTKMFPDLTYQVMQGSKYQFIEQQKGMIIDRSEQEILPILPPKEIAKLLGIETGTPIIEKRTRGYLADNTVFEYSRNYLKSSDYKFTLIAKRRHHHSN